jgi:hypothetical protein
MHRHDEVKKVPLGTRLKKKVLLNVRSSWSHVGYTCTTVYVLCTVCFRGHTKHHCTLQTYFSVTRQCLDVLFFITLAHDVTMWIRLPAT